ncbi:MAG: hypothetical protein H7061_08285, partial [Bdellovibrionaceae bacterium]|nr:hypothetical protein [Bdellovibrio sp.]
VTEVDANKSAKEKFKNLRKQFPMLATQGGAGWFELSDVTVGDLAKVDSSFSNKVTSSDLANNSAGGERRQPWTGASAVIKLKLFSSLQIPFLGKVAKDKDSFSFPIRAFIIRSPSTEECKTFFKKRFREGISQIDQFQTMTQGLSSPPPINPADVYGVGQEDNGC